MPVQGRIQHLLRFGQATQQRKNITLNLGHPNHHIRGQIGGFHLFDQAKQFHVAL